MYENNPYSILTRHNVVNMEEAKQNILGGETAIWTEQTDGGNIEAKIEPRTAAYGEALWLGDSAGGWREAHQRLVNHRERLVGRGVGADQITQRWCVQNPGLCLLSQPAVSKEIERCPSPSPSPSSTTASPTTTNTGQAISDSLYLSIVLACISSLQR